MKKTVIGIALALTATAVPAQGVEPEDFYIGTGIGISSASGGGGTATGFQLFAGYKLRMVDLGDGSLAIEAGYTDTGTFRDGNRWGTNYSGLWTTAVLSYPVAQDINVIARAGADFGPFRRAMIGGGVGFALSPELELRGEYIVRDRIDSLMASVVYQF